MTVFEFNHYKDIVRHWVAQTPGGGHGQYRKISAALNAHTTTISQIFSGSKDLTLEQGYALTEYLGLSETECRYFILLLERERAGTRKLHGFFEREILKARREHRSVQSRVD